MKNDYSFFRNILPGITRSNGIEICNSLKILKVEEEVIYNR
jgi:branched-subunit amino acid aminotransferase/4-amino-4-deoxychorismate lyase